MKLSIEEKAKIKSLFENIETKEDLLELLNYVKSTLYGKNTNPFEIKHINFHCNPKANLNRYRKFEINKKSGKKRTIYAPNNGLKAIQNCLNHIFQAIYQVHKSATGFVPGKSIVDNAQIHVGNLYVFNIDLKDFFPSIDQARIWGRLQHPPFNLNKKQGKLNLANIIASLCCHEIEVERFDDERGWYKENRFVLPQGAPTSPSLSNIICQQLDYYLSAVAKRFGLKYSRYADDITFSSMHNVYQAESGFRKELHRIIKEQRFYINPSKTRLQKQGFRQEVTGIVVNEKTNVSSKYIKELRKWLYYWEAYGYGRANSFFIPKYKADKGHIKKGEPNMQNILDGKLDYLKMIKGATNPTYLKLHDRFSKLINNDANTSSAGGTKEVEKKEISTNELKVSIESVSETLEPIILIKEILIKKGETIPYSSFVSNYESLELKNPILHHPRKLVNILNKFTDNQSALKFATHTWDARRDSDFLSDIETFVKQAKHEYFKFNKELKYLKKELDAKISQFLFNPNVKEKGWGINRIKFGWSSEELKTYIKNTPEAKPEGYILPKYAQKKIKQHNDNMMVSNFKHVIDVFKNEIEIRDENDTLMNMIMHYHDKYISNFEPVDVENLENKNFYTDVDYFGKALELVFENIRKRDHHTKVSYIGVDNEDSFQLEIAHHDSFNTGRSINDPKLLGANGDFGTIRGYLKNLCDWSIESDFIEGQYRINYLSSDASIDKHTKIENAIGFKYIFTFYR